MTKFGNIVAEDKVTLILTKDEAIVLFEFLSRFSDTDELSIEDQAEARVLWNMCCGFEKTLAEPFDPEWNKILHAARAAVRDEAIGGEPDIEKLL